MDPAALAGLCLLLARGETAQPLPAGVNCPPPRSRAEVASSPSVRGDLVSQMVAPEAREAITRVAFAEAANQGDSGLAAVVYTILNRVQDGRWGGSVEAVVNARRQFEPVMRAGGSWRNLPAASAAQRARIDTIINLALDGRLPDPTNGARFFQNPRIVADRAMRGEVSAGLVNFGGTTPSAVIGAHSFYVEAGAGVGRGGTPNARPSSPRGSPGSDPWRAAGGSIFVGENRAFDAASADGTPAGEVGEGSLIPIQVSDPSHDIFIAPDGRPGVQAR